MNRTFVGLCVAGVLGLAASAFAQSAPSGATTTSAKASAVVFAYLEIQAASTDRDTQLAALEHVRELISAGHLSTNATSAIYQALSELAFSGTVDPTITGMSVINNYPDIRTAACQILGHLGGKRASNTLLRVVFEDLNTTVLSEAIFQLGHLGHNPGNSISQAIVWAFARQDAIMQDNNLAFASLLALGNLAKVNGGITDPDVFDMIARIQAENYSGPVKAEAARVLGEIQKFG